MRRQGEENNETEACGRGRVCSCYAWQAVQDRQPSAKARKSFCSSRRPEQSDNFSVDAGLDRSGAIAHHTN